MSEPQSRDTTGPATDKLGNPVIDPTKNVLDLVEASMRRQDDLRAADREYLDAKLGGIEREFALSEDRRREQKVDTKTAVDAALLAAKEAVKEQTTASAAAIAKSETSAAEQSKQQNATFTAALKGVTDVLADVKERVSKAETRAQAQGESRTETRLDTGTILAILSFVALVVFFIVGLK